jgi:hypothetical protein
MNGVASTWAGNGTITANSGTTSWGSTGNGGGGRIAITGYVTDTHSGNPAAYALDPSNGTAIGAAGTVYTKSSSQTNGTLLIANNSVAPGSGKYAKSNVTNLTLDSLVAQNRGYFYIPVGSTLTIASSGSMTGNNTGLTFNYGTTTLPASITLSHWFFQRGTLSASSTSLTVASGGTFEVDQPSTLSSITVQSGGNMTHDNNGSTEATKMDLTVTDLTINSGGTINVNGQGYSGGNGPGVGTSGGGGGYGGMGGYTTGGNTYGSFTAPNNIGSSGAGSASGAGGGAIKITVSGNLSNSGTISANGNNSTSCCSNGGGSGGSVWIVFTGGSSTWSGNGSITANGGTTSWSNTGNGGGGRIAITGYVTDTHSGTTSTYAPDPSNGTAIGAAGTILTKSSSQTNGTLKIDNNNVTQGSGKYARTNVTNLTLDS